MAAVEQLYFVAIIPSDEVSNEITGIKKKLAESYYSWKALKVMPHITLKAPFLLPTADDQHALAWFSAIHPTIKPFAINLDGFGAFNNKNHPVIFIQPNANPSLHNLQKEIIGSFKQHFPLSLLCILSGILNHISPLATAT